MSEKTYDWELMRRTLAPNASEDDFGIFAQQVERTGLDPFARQIYAVGRWDSKKRKEVLAVQVSIDGFRLVAERTGKYAGQQGPFWCGDDGKWTDVWLKDEPPAAARVAALRNDFAEPCWGVARFSSYAQKTKEGNLTRFWKAMPDLMIAKVAEALALRRAFPQELSGLYTSDEMDQAEPVQKETSPFQLAIVTESSPPPADSAPKEKPPFTVTVTDLGEVISDPPRPDEDSEEYVAWARAAFTAIRAALSRSDDGEAMLKTADVADTIAMLPEAGQRALRDPHYAQWGSR